MREAPNGTSPVVLSLKAGDQIEKVGNANGKWCKARALGRTGFVSCEFVVETKSDADDAVADDTPAAAVVPPVAAPKPSAPQTARADRSADGLEGADDDGNENEEEAAEAPRKPGASPDHSGGFFKAALGVGVGSFDLETADDEGDVGYAFEMTGGWSGESGFGVGVTFSVTEMAYQSLILAAVNSDEASSTLLLALGDVSLWYFAEASTDLVFHFHAGLGASSVRWKTVLFEEKDSSAGATVGAGAALYITESLGLSFDLTWRSYGLELSRGGGSTGELATTGLLLGLIYR